MHDTEADLAVEVGGGTQIAEGLQAHSDVSEGLGFRHQLTDQPATQPSTPKSRLEHEPAQPRGVFAVVGQRDAAGDLRVALHDPGELALPWPASDRMPGDAGGYVSLVRRVEPVVRRYQAAVEGDDRSEVAGLEPVPDLDSLGQPRHLAIMASAGDRHKTLSSCDRSSLTIDWRDTGLGGS
jgi:hypothetical protein